MPATNFLEEALLKVLNEVALPTTTKLYVTLAHKASKTLVKPSECEEIAYTAFARQQFTTSNTITPGGAGEAEPSSTKNKSAIAFPEPKSAVTNGNVLYALWVDALSGTANVWYYAKLAAEATIVNGSTTEIVFATNSLEVTAI